MNYIQTKVFVGKLHHISAPNKKMFKHANWCTIYTFKLELVCGLWGGCGGCGRCGEGQKSIPSVIFNCSPPY